MTPSQIAPMTLLGQGSCADLIRAQWASDREPWQAPRQTAIAFLIASPDPTFLFWGEDLRCYFNDPAQLLVVPGFGMGGRGEAAGIATWSTLVRRLRDVLAGNTETHRSDLDWRVSPVFDDRFASGVGGALAQCRTATANEAHRRVSESQARLRLGLEAARMVTWEFDLLTGKLTRSANSEAIFGGGDTPEDFAARMPAEDVAADKAVLEAALQTPDSHYQSEFRYNHPDGRQLHLQNWGKFVRDADGDVVRVHGICMDVTERKRAEIALQTLNETLEQEVRKRTDALIAAEKALRLSQKMEALGHLTGGVAHDFNNLLGAMVGSFDLMKRKADDPDRVRALADAGLKVAERGTRLTSQLLTFSRGQPIELKPVCVADVLTGMQDLLERTLGPLIRLDLHLGEHGAVLSDATQLEMAILNLAINARDAMAQGGDLAITTRNVQLEGDLALPPGDYVELIVRDTGTGMSANVAALAFDPFFTTKEVGKGTGLGLSQVYGIARQAGGLVHIDTAPGQGTAVRMLLPNIPTPEPCLAEPSVETQSARSHLVMIVDDDADLREVMVAALEDLGYGVLEAPDGMSAMTLLDVASDALPDLLIVDYTMPGMTGAELAKLVRAKWTHLPIIFASGHANTDAIEDATGRATCLLRKPFRIEQLQRAIETALDSPALI